jgi:hypothetical protein
MTQYEENLLIQLQAIKDIVTKDYDEFTYNDYKKIRELVEG